MFDPNCPKCGAHDYALFAAAAQGCPHCMHAEIESLHKDAERLDWIERNLIEGKWDGTIGRPKSWVMIGPYRHTLQKMRGDNLREAIDRAMEASHDK